MCWCLLYSNCNWDTHCIIVLSVFRPFCGSGFVFERTSKQKTKKNKEPFWRGEEKHLQPKDITVRIRLRPFKQSQSAGSRAEFLLLLFFFFQKITISVDIHVIYASTAIQGWIVNISHLLFVATAL
jgi:hypothetical protein